MLLLAESHVEMAVALKCALFSLLMVVYNFALQLTRLEIENYNQQTEMESNIEMNQHLQVSVILPLWMCSV